jgi:hypothetical protein
LTKKTWENFREMCFSNVNSTSFANFWKKFQFFISKNWEKYHAMMPSTYTFSNKNKNMK